MRAALTTFAAMDATGRRILILGDMTELGQHANRYHRDMAAQILAMKPDRIFLCGPLMAELWDALSGIATPKIAGSHYPSVTELLTDITDHLQSGDRVLIKASNSIGLSRVVEKLTNRSEA